MNLKKGEVTYKNIYPAILNAYIVSIFVKKKVG